MAQEDRAAVQKDAKAAEKADAEKEQLRKTVDDYRDSLQRLQAEFENYKKRVDRETAVAVVKARAETVKQLLPALDSFELALKSTADREKFLKGIEMIFAQLHSALEDLGLRRIEAVGKPLDPYRHEVLLHAESDNDGIVLEELQPGYMLHDMVLRCSKVKVGRKKEGKNGQGSK